MKHLKSKLLVSVCMLCISAIMLTGVSFAWYTLSTNPEVKSLSATVQANESLEIALVKTSGETATDVDTRSKSGDAAGYTTGDYYTWGNLVDLTDEISGVSAENLALRPVHATAQGFALPEYGDDGRLVATQTWNTKLSTSDETEVSGKPFLYGCYKDSTQYVVRYDFWLRTNTAGQTIYLQADGTVRDSENHGDTTTAGTWVKGAGTDEAKWTKALGMAVRVDDGTTFAIGDFDDTTGKLNSDVAIITGATANQAYKVHVYIYVDGDYIDNTMLSEVTSGMQANVQFGTGSN